MCFFLSAIGGSGWHWMPTQPVAGLLWPQGRQMAASTKWISGGGGGRMGGFASHYGHWWLVVIFVVIASWLFYRYAAPNNWRVEGRGAGASLHHRTVRGDVWLSAHYLSRSAGDRCPTLLSTHTTIITLALFPIIVWMYIRLARSEEKELVRKYGDQYRRYQESCAGVLARHSQMAGTG